MVAVTSSFFVHFTTFSITIGKQMKSIDFELKLLPLSVLRTRMFCSLAVVNIDTMPDISREHLFVGLHRPAYSLRQGRFCLCITALLLLSEFCVSASLSVCWFNIRIKFSTLFSLFRLMWFFVLSLSFLFFFHFFSVFLFVCDTSNVFTQKYSPIKNIALSKRRVEIKSSK